LMIDALLFVVHAVIGAFVAVVMRARDARYLASWSAGKRYILGAVAGYVYYWLYSELSFPNLIMAFVVGYAAKEFLEGLFERLRGILHAGGGHG